MSAKIIQSWLRLRASYYFLPALMSLGAILLALLTTTIDLNYQSEIRDLLGWFFASSVESARSILTTIASSMITVAAVTFSLTMVAVTTAAGQYGPRLIGNFMRDRANQITLGMFLSTFLYCMMVLKSVSEETQINPDVMAGLTPNLSILVALLLTLTSIGVLIFFIHHIPETLNVGTITGRVSKALIKQIESGRYPATEDLDVKPSDPLGNPFDTSLTQTVKSGSSGYIEAISLSGMMEFAEAQQLRLRLLKAPGEFVLAGDKLIDVIPDDTQSDFDQARFDEKIGETLLTFIALGRERTEHQNILFLADELVEVAARAISPGINDPFTAINCIHWMGDICCSMMQAPTVSDCILSSTGTPRIWTQSVSFEQLCDTLFGQLRPYVCEDANVARHTMNILYQLKGRTTDATEAIIDSQIENLLLAIDQSRLGEAEKARLKPG